MSDVNEGNGSCLCGAVRITATSLNNSVGACHCKMCRKWSSGPWMAVDCGTDVSFEGEENISLFHSSRWAERAFCNKCGTLLYYHLIDSNRHMISAGVFESDNSVFDRQLFIDEKPSYYCFANETEYKTGTELFAKYAPSIVSKKITRLFRAKKQ